MSGSPPGFDLGSDERILATVDAIPRGRVASYGQVAQEAGLPGRARLVGRVLGRLDADRELPWWRVLRADGSLAELGGGGARQRGRLEAEGVRFDGRGRVRMDDHRWQPGVAGEGSSPTELARRADFPDSD